MKCPSCNGNGYQLVEENPEECLRCNGEGYVKEDSLFEQIVKVVTPYNYAIAKAYDREDQERQHFTKEMREEAISIFENCMKGE